MCHAICLAGPALVDVRSDPPAVTLIGAMILDDGVVIGADSRQAQIDSHSGCAVTSLNVDKLSPIFESRVVWGYFGLGSKGYQLQKFIEDSAEPQRWKDWRGVVAREVRRVNGASPDIGVLFAGILEDRPRILIVNQSGTDYYPSTEMGLCGNGRVAAEVGVKVALNTRPEADAIDNFVEGMEATIEVVDDLHGPLSVWRIPAVGSAYKVR